MAEPDFTTNIICFESRAFFALVEEVVERIKDKNPALEEKWIDDEQAMSLLKITSKTTLQKYRDEGRIRYSQPSRKVILYDRESILEFIEEHAKDTFQ